MLFSFSGLLTRMCRVLLPMLLLTFVIGVRSAHAADYGGTVTKQQFQVSNDQSQPSGGLTDLISFSIYGTWSTAGAKLNWQVNSVGVYNGVSNGSPSHDPG